MNAADNAYLAGFNAAVDLAERAGARILQGMWGNVIRREHAAAGLLAFVDESRDAIQHDVGAQDAATSAAALPPAIDVFAIGHAVVISADKSVTFIGGPKPDRTAARAQGYSGDVCDHCGSMSMKRSGSCLTCEACGTTSGCS